VLKNLLLSLPESPIFVQEVITIVEEDIVNNHPNFSIVLIQSLNCLLPAKKPTNSETGFEFDVKSNRTHGNKSDDVFELGESSLPEFFPA
jgi:hypothetical protein